MISRALRVRYRIPHLAPRVPTLAWRSLATPNYVSRVIGFVKQESAALASAMGEDADALGLPAPIARALYDTSDPHRRLQLLLLHPHNVIPAASVLHHAARALEAGTLEPPTLHKLVERLALHRRFEYIWTAMEACGCTLTDIEEMIGTVEDALAAVGHAEVGMLELAMSTEKLANVQLRRAVLQTIGYRTGMERGELAERCNQLRRERERRERASPSRPLPVSPQMPTAAAAPPLLLVLLAAALPPSVESLPGLLTFCFPNCSLAQLPPRLTLNYLDIATLCDHTPAGDLHRLYPLYAQAVPAPPFPRDHTLHRIVQLLLKHASTAHLAHCVATYHASLEPQQLALALVHIYIHSPEAWAGVRVVPPPQFVAFLLKRLHLAGGRRLEQGVLRLLETVEIGPEAARQALRGLAPLASFYRRVLARPWPAEVLIEIAELHGAATAGGGADADIHTALFLRLLEALAKDPRLLGDTTHTDLLYHANDLFELSSDSLRKLFFRYLSMFGAQVAALPAAQICRVVLSIHGALAAPRWRANRQFLVEKLMQAVLRGIDARLRLRLAVVKIKEVVAQLPFDTRFVHALVYKYLVKYNPRASLALVQHYRRRKLLLTNVHKAGVMSGILETPLLLRQERVRLFEEFRAALRASGYKSRYRVHTAVELLELMVQIHERAPTRLRHEIVAVLRMAQRWMVPRQLVFRWAVRLGLVSADVMSVDEFGDYKNGAGPVRAQ